MNDEAMTAKLKAENEALRKLIFERSKDLFDALGALTSMWNQYCPPPWTHMFMSAGEDAEEVLKKWQLMRPDETSIYIDGLVIDEDMPDIVLELITKPVPLDE
ncbi:hypothetical protein Q5H93_08090 [Hymenobacter sp. ASUV-10]|uniref:Uncharacterized protein n=1 Tax=Hymenobacter aranciens TaxID=3063996 RepID=A0ABT9BA94_9BACT|nr:hypothetical protein [Hymenobacter sp. ASUV-10]MDO7874690.1 hypothetical protein [Hymenobacter sp. ASUV-10]